MQYRKYGKTGLSVSEIGVGGHREGMETGQGLARTARFFMAAQERAAIVGHAIDQGVTYFDTTFGAETESLGESLKILGKRDGLFASVMSVDFFNNLPDDVDVRTYTRSEVECRLGEFGFDYIDQFMMGAMETGDPLSHPRTILEDAFDELSKLRDEGKIGCVGFSCHNPDYAARLLEEFPQFDAVMTPYNFVNRASEGNFTEALKKTGVAWIVMKPMVWKFYGIPVTSICNLKPIPGRLEFDPTVPIGRMALQFILNNPLVTTIVPAVNSIQAVDQNVQASGMELTDQDVRHLNEYAEAMSAEDFMPLCFSGLLERNGRILGNTFLLARNRLGFEVEQIDWAADNAEERAREVAAELLNDIRKDPKWAPYLE